ncbi:ABC transporter permease [Thermomicrobiaceae bacterium CFH 74404]|uniref:ABC transporter permease n=1 Tax=Thermalbibacter longus TaxID=2951981 RepID=A0AA41WHB2_9BACT|nr:ABC transporter permease [Thermalbibacter longus]MCM8750035.1 ABC transporter permease [Thermalbibacter longus]
MLSYMRRNRSLVVGLCLILLILLFAGLGRLLWDTSLAAPLSAPPNRPPSWEHPLGTDRQGRDLLAVMIVGTPLTLYIGLLAGFIGVAIGTVLALTGAYYGGVVDSLIRGVVDVGLTIPTLLVLILLAVSVRSSLSVSQMALVVASLSWLWPTRTIRSQVLSIKERAYIQVARLSGASNRQIIFFEIMPNLLPYLAATFVGAVGAAILASIGLEVIGLGPIEANTLGMTIYWVTYYAALLHGMWWWFMPPVVIIIMVFVGLFSISAGLDELANPRTRRTV